MRARRKGTNNPYMRVERVQLQDLDILYSADVMEFEPYPDEFPSKEEILDESYWQEIRNQAAIAAMQRILSSWTIDYDVSSIEYITKTAVELADALVEQLKK